MPLDIATTLQLQGCTAHYLSHSLFPLEPGHRCLIHAGAGGLGQLLIQLAKIRGAEVFTTVGSTEKGSRLTGGLRNLAKLSIREAVAAEQRARSDEAMIG